MDSCKFCGLSGTHINRDKLCARCYRILGKKERRDAEEQAWVEEMVAFNKKHGGFIPVSMRKEQWSCKICGTKYNRDSKYTNHCALCSMIAKSRKPSR